MIRQADVGILFGPKMGDETLAARYGLLVEEIGRTGLEAVVLRSGPDGYDGGTQAFRRYTELEAGKDIRVVEEPVQVGVLRDFSGARRWGIIPGTRDQGIPAINDQGVYGLTRDKAATRSLLGDLMPEGVVLSADRSDAEEIRKSMPGELAVVKPTTGRASRGVSVVRLGDRGAWREALQSVPAGESVMVEEFVDTSRGYHGMPGYEGRPSTLRVIAIDGEPSVVALRVGQEGALKVDGDATEEYVFCNLSALAEDELSIVRKAHQAAANKGNGFSYMGVDLLPGERMYLGELNARPAIIEPKHSPEWSRSLARDSAAQLLRLHATIEPGTNQ